MTDKVIRAVGLCKCFQTGSQSVPVLRDIEFDVARGECVFLVGPSGSGKTTLLSIIGCILSADAGSLEILGTNASCLTPADQCRFRRQNIGFVFQRFHLFDALTATENVRIPCELLRWPKARSRERARELLSLVGLADKADSRVTRLSTGQRQRVAFARALAGDPELILADEPTASLDADSGFTAMRILKDLCHELKKTVVVVTHDPRIESMADRILTMADGCIAANSPSNLLHPRAVSGRAA